MKIRQKTKRGFTLVEMITSIAIIAVISVLFATVFGGAMKTSGNAVAGNQLSASAQSAIESFDIAAASRASVDGTVSLHLSFAGATFQADASAYQAGQNVYWVFQVK